MAPAKKKKKAAANPARGFATVSLPSRASAARQEDENLEPRGASSEDGGLDASRNANNLSDRDAKQSINPTQNTEIQNMTPEELEEHLKDAELQSILDDHGSRCKAEAARQVARLEAERRMLRSQAMRINTNSWFPDQVVDDILKASSSGENLDDPTFPSTAQHPGFKSETDLLLRVWTLKQTLTEMQFPVIDEALLHVLTTSFGSLITPGKEDIWGLLEVLGWYARHASDYDLPKYDYTFTKFRRELPPDGHKYSSSEAAEAVAIDSNANGHGRLLVTELPVQSKYREAAGSVSKPCATSQEDSSKRQANMPLDLDRSAANETSSSHQNTGDSETETEDDSGDDSDPSKLVETYLKIKSSLLVNTQSEDISITSNRRHRKLGDRLKKIERDILFDEDAATTAWHGLEPKLLAESVKLRATKRRTASSSKLSDQNRSTSPTHAAEEPEEVMVLGDMFQEAVRPGENPTLEQNSSVQLVEFGTWSGVHPRRLLEELCKLRDAHYQLGLKLVSSSPFAFRQKISIKWSSEQPLDSFVPPALPLSLSYDQNARNLDLEMQSVATPTKTQSEAYICTLALFAVAAHEPRGQKMSLRLPPVWRDLWTQLIESRRKAIESFDKSTLKGIKSLISTAKNAQSQGKSLSLSHEKESPNNHADALPQPRSNTKLDFNQAKAEWIRKESSASFQSMIRTRRDLPIYNARDRILHTIADQAVTIICAETGAGKSTQVPSYILENELSSGRDCRILVTQPRRISAITLARRVSQEIGERAASLGTRESLVGYAIRLETKTSASTRLTFATTGVLLRMLESSPDLEDVDYVILDEVHERTMDLDLLFIALRRAINRRHQLKLVLMSATIDGLKLSEYFGGAPVLDIAGRTYPVETFFLEDAVESSIDHLSIEKSRTPPEPDFNDDEDASDRANGEAGHTGNLKGYDNKTRAYLSKLDEYRIDYDLIAKLVYVVSSSPKYQRYSNAILIFLPGIQEIRRLHNTIMSDKAFQSGWIIHMLHSSFSSDDLERAFAIPPRGFRKIVIATNIAETGITIPDVTAVIDTCKEKVMRFDEKRQISKLVEGFISQSSSRQRRGRAARVQPGLCFHLVTKHRYEKLMPERHVPEMLRLSLQEPILRIKIWGLGEIEETLGAAIDPPSGKNVRRAVETLKDVGALTSTETLTPLGRQLARLPLDVELGKACILGIIFRCLDPAVSITAILSSKSPFQSTRSSSALSGQNGPPKRDEQDVLSTYVLYKGWRKARQAGAAAEFCRRESISDQSMAEIEQQRVAILVSLVDARLLSLDEAEKSALRVARTRRSGREFYAVPPRYQTSSESDDAVCSVIAMAFYPKLLTREGKNWRNVATNQHVNVSRSSTYYRDAGLARWMSFYQAMQAKSGQLNVSGTSTVPDSAILLLLGQAEFRMYSGVIKIDGSRVQMAVRDWKTLLAVKILRSEISSLVARFLRSPGTTFTARENTWFASWLAVVRGGTEQRHGESS